MSKRALITGITGQDGSYLAELLLERGYEVHGLVRHVALEDHERRLWRIRPILNRISLHAGSLESYVGLSFEDEFTTLQTNIVGTHHVLAAVRALEPRCRVYFAGSSEQFGNSLESTQSEATTFWPCSPYAISKIAGWHMARHYRETHGLFVACGIAFNHESPRRGDEFVTRKITKAVARIRLGLQRDVQLGNLHARRDWGHARDYVEGMWLMLQNDRPDDFVLATGETHSVREFAELAFERAGLSCTDHLSVDHALLRPTDVAVLCGDAAKARRELGWRPRVSFEELVREMVDHDMSPAGHGQAQG
jgi:GDPmannose 4,6-dehydratase